MAGENDTIGIYQELLNRNAVPPEHRDTVGELVRRGVLKASAQEKPNALVKGATDTLRQFNDTLTFGFYDKGVAAGKTVAGSGNYAENIASERAKQKEAYSQTVPWLVGQTAGNVVQAALTLPGKTLKTVVDVGEAAYPVAKNAMAAFMENIPQAARTGTAYGAANAAGHSDPRTMGEGITDVAEGAVSGAILGPTVYTGMYGAGLAAQKFGQRRSDTRIANQERAAEARSVGIVDPLPGIVSDNPMLAYATRTTGAGIGGNPVGVKAAKNIGQIQRSLNRTLAGPIDGQEAGNLGRTIQDDLRRALTQRSRSSDDIAGMSSDELQAITGKITPEGFQPPRPKVDPVQPRPIDPVQPRDVGPEPQRPQTADAARYSREALATTERDIAAAVAEHNQISTAAAAVEARYKPTFDRYNDLIKQEAAFRDNYNRMAQEGAFIKFRQPGEQVPAYQARLVEMSKQHEALVAEINKMKPDLSLAQRAISRYGDSNERIAKIRALHNKRNLFEQEVAAARGAEAAENVSYTKAAEDFSANRARVAAEAAEETARLREQARLEAEQATTSSQRAAEERYQQQIKKGNTGFRTGASRESYPTELSAAYEAAYRETPKIRVNPLGDGYGVTETGRLLEGIAKEGKSSLKIRDFDGKAFDTESGGLAQPFSSYLRSQIGSDMTQRIEALAEIRARGPVAQPGIEGMRGLLSDIRKLARDAERSRYSPQPRTEDAALLRRIATAIQKDLYDATSRSGRPSNFTTAQGDYKVLEGGRTQFGDKAPTDSTFYVKPNLFNRLTKGTGEVDKTHSIPATLSLKEEKGSIGYYKNQSREFDRSTLIPYSRNPEPGLIPIQVWADGTRITYGSPVITRGTTSGERAVSMFKNVDEQYSQYVNDLRKPLSKIFGEKVDGVQALERISTAAMKGETGLLGAYMRVMTEKSDPTKGAAAVIYHMTGGGKDLPQFMKTFRELPDVSKRLLFAGPQGRQLEQELTRYVNVGQRLEKYVNASKQQALVNPSRITHLMTAAAVYMNLPAVITMVAGNAVAARVLSSPRLVRWLTDISKASRGGFDAPAFSQHISRLSAMAGRDDEAGKALFEAVASLIKQQDKSDGRPK